MKDILFFDSMLTPKIITFIYWLLLVSALIAGISSIFSGYGGGFLTGLGIIVFGFIGARMWCELLMVIFKIHENLQKIANKSE